MAFFPILDRILSEQHFDLFFDDFEVFQRIEISYDLAFLVEQKFGKIAWNSFSWFFLLVKQFAVISEVPINGMRIDPVDFYLLEKSKSRPEIFFRKPANILIRSSFLIEELIGGEGQNLKTFVHQLVV